MIASSSTGRLQQSQTIQSPLSVNPFHTTDKDNIDSMEEALQQLAADASKKASCEHIAMSHFSWYITLLLQ